MRTAIIGAGFAGLSSAKVLRECGIDVTVFDRTPDVGGVWSETRRYPGLRTQNNKGTYALSDHPMPKSFPQWPTGEQVQSYLQDYVDKFDLGGALRLSTEVISAEPRPEGGWDLTTAHDGSTSTESFDHLVVANGIFSRPRLPEIPGLDEFRAAGGQAMAASDFHDLDDARGENVIVLGYGKSACDVAVPISDVAGTTTVVARQLLWKMPRKLGGLLNYKFLMLTRMGEGLFRYIEPVGFERFLHGPGNPVRKSMIGSVQSVITRQLKLREMGLVPNGTFEDIARSTVSLATERFYEQVVDGKIDVRRDAEVARLVVDDAGRWAELTTGDRIPADVIVAATGFHQEVPFFSAEINDALTDDRGNFQLYRQILPLTVPDLTFAGYNSSFFSPLSAEMSAVWIAAHLHGALDLPSVDEMRAHIDRRLAWMEERTNGKHARGTNIIPFSMHNIDEVLADLGLDVGRGTKMMQWLAPVKPGSYKSVTAKLRKRLGTTPAGADARGLKLAG
ncbi:flavin-containing monooxygenase [Williamsia serinedens]|uniref:Flavoprotein CzcO associated with the cation diffusion facilitator CzcD n=1 Tax=Williamsia serinedens TaxID=391736 RepID=A0ABT1GYF2_9NOCA|nr:NAD(P)/FAD-dependent oxidoreductase [Williamsia serinedens]MCP2159744.1 putative flavoprotein CzcO associated with the cation diffusion facilitator CzcD [Williamsia serinedens]